MKKFLILGLFLIGCSDNKVFLGEIKPSYRKDYRTNLCFAETGMAQGYSFTHVPCDSVSKWLLK